MTEDSRCFDVSAATCGPRHHFFGYYDKSPWDATGRYLLALESAFMDRAPGPEDRAIVGVVDTAQGNRFRAVCDTRAWNWQQGAMLQWLPSQPDRLIVYNDRQGDQYVSVVRDIHTGESRILPRPIYCLSPDGSYALSLNFARLHWIRPGYGYAGPPDPWADELRPEDDGIYLMDLATGEYHLIISLAEMAALATHPSAGDAAHKFNHLLFSPDGRRFIFLHRWRAADGSRHHRMCTADPRGQGLWCAPLDDMVSHFDWFGPDKILAWARRADNGDRYYIFTDHSDHAEVLGEGVLTRDGHCSFSPDRKWLLTDTYPDHERMRTLILYRMADGCRIVIAKFFSPPVLENHIRCDLHPRWSRDGRQVCIDSAHEGSRQMYVLDVGPVVMRA